MLKNPFLIISKHFKMFSNCIIFLSKSFTFFSFFPKKFSFILKKSPKILAYSQTRNSYFVRKPLKILVLSGGLTRFFEKTYTPLYT